MLESKMNLNLDLIVYLRTSPEVAYQRMRSRNRAEEDGAPFSYLKLLHESYEDWLLHQKFGDVKVPILVLDADQDLDTMLKIYTEYQAEIRGEAPLKGPIKYSNESHRLKGSSSGLKETTAS